MNSKTCRLCNRQTEVLFVIPNACPNISYLPLTPVALDTKDLYVYQCSSCGLVQLSEDDKDSVEYEDYFMATSESRQMQECQEKQAELLKQVSKGQWPLTARVLEVGCGDGSFIKHLERNGFAVSAIEPSKRFFEHAKKVSSNVRNEYMSNNVAGSPYDILVAREVLEHIYDFNTFLRQMFLALESNGLLMIQVPRLETALEDLRLHTFFTDHVNYFSEDTLRLTLELNGFKVLYMESHMDGEYTVAIGSKKDIHKGHLDGWMNKINCLKSFIENNSNKKIVLWGAGGKGLSILSAIEARPSNNLELVDCDSMKIGRYTPVTNFLIQDSSKLLEINPDIVIILADAYRKEIIEKINRLGFEGTVTYPGDDLL